MVRRKTPWFIWKMSVTVDGTCEEDSDCGDDGACGISPYPGGEKICCPSGNTVSFLVPTIRYCTGQPTGATCRIEDGGNGPLCSSGICVKGFCQDGPQDVGEACDENLDCTSNVCVDGVCQDGKLGVGETCEEDSNCDNLTCGRIYPTTDRECCSTAEKVNGIFCSNQPNGLPCLENPMCASDVCVIGICQDGPQEINEPCDDEEDCVDAATCVGGTCQGSTNGVGSTCEEDGDCDAGLFCRSFFNPDDGSSKLGCCETSAGSTSAGTFCQNQPVGAGCPADVVCGSGVCVSNRCVDGPQDVGESCDRLDDSDCANGACGRPSLPMDENNPDDVFVCCESGSKILNGLTGFVCTQPENAACTVNEMCISGFCAVGICRDGPQGIGEVCDETVDCEAGNACNVANGGICQEGLLTEGEQCNDFDDCANSVGCGRSSYPDGEFICCPTGTLLQFIQDEGLFCGKQSEGAACTPAVAREICASEACGQSIFPSGGEFQCCSENGAQFVGNQGFFCKQPTGSQCPTSTPDLCISGICNDDGFCA